MHFSLKSLVISTMIDANTFAIIEKICSRFELPPEVEFSCYDLYPIYFKHFYADLNTKYQTQALSTSRRCNEAFNVIGRIKEHIEETTLLQIVSIISICAKYVMGPKSCRPTRNTKEYLNRYSDRPFSKAEFFNAEYCVFRHLQFKLKMSQIYSEMYRLVQVICKNFAAIRFDDLHCCCVTILRVIYHNRQKFDSTIRDIETSSYNDDGVDNDLKLSAMAVTYSITKHYSYYANKIIDEIVRNTYLNESFLRKLTQSVQYIIQ